MRPEVAALVALALIVYAQKSLAPLVLGGRPLPRWLQRLAMLVPAALLAALVATSTFADGRTLSIDAKAAGLAAAAVALWRKAGFVTTVVIAAVVTAAVRAFT
jgi:branched-subunit amino acid transport protein